jgi:ribosome recycling factor
MYITKSSDIIEYYTKTLSRIRTGSVNASILDHVLIDAYDTKMKIIEVATVNKPEPSQLIITPFDKNLVAVIAKAITVANIGVNPVDNGAGVILNFPPLTEESRKIKVKELMKEDEKVKIQIRQERQDALNKAKKMKENGEYTENQLSNFEIDLQEEVNKLNKQVDTLTKAKEVELMKL